MTKLEKSLIGALIALITALAAFLTSGCTLEYAHDQNSRNLRWGVNPYPPPANLQPPPVFKQPETPPEV